MNKKRRLERERERERERENTANFCRKSTNVSTAGCGG